MKKSSLRELVKKQKHKKDILHIRIRTELKKALFDQARDLECTATDVIEAMLYNEMAFRIRKQTK